jgi:hypothetical protein
MIRPKNKIITKSKTFLVVLLIHAFLLFFTALTLANNFQYTIKGTDKINITEASFQRFIEFTKGRFYSKVYGAKIYQVFGLYFALSEKGNAVVFSFCEDDMIGCNTNLLKYQTKAKCEKISGEPCNIIAINKDLVLNNKIITIENEKQIKEYFVINSDKKIPNFSFEIRAQNLRDFGNDDYQ